jgi:polysaccharide export outer membrane protein
MLKSTFKSLILLSLLGLLLDVESCSFRKKMVYFQGSTSSKSDSLRQGNYTPVLRTDDLLSIFIGGGDPDAVIPFNMPLALNTTPTYGGYATGTSTPPGYLIDAKGNIDFPLLGPLHVAGLDRIAATELLREKLTPYIKHPAINIRIVNFKVTVLGEVRLPGTFTIPNERITLLEAIGIAGDLNITAVRKNILVIRDDNGKKTEYRIDLTSKELFSSPVYYLNQNDVVYVEPNRSKRNSAAVDPANVGIIISTVSLVITVLALITRH